MSDKLYLSFAACPLNCIRIIIKFTPNKSTVRFKAVR